MVNCKKVYPRVSEEDCIDIIGILAGNESNFVALYNRYETPIRGYIKSLLYTSNYDIANCETDTINTDTFIKFCKILPQYRGEENVNNRLRRIAKSSFLDCLKKQRDKDENFFIDRYIDYQQSLRTYLQSLYYPDKTVCNAEMIHNDTFMFFCGNIFQYRGKHNTDKKISLIANKLYIKYMKKTDGSSITIADKEVPLTKDKNSSKEDKLSNEKKEQLREENKQLRDIAKGMYIDCTNSINVQTIEIDNIPLEPISTIGIVLPKVTQRRSCIENCLDKALKKSNTNKDCIKGLILLATGSSKKEIALSLNRPTANAVSVFLIECRKKLTNKSQLRDCLEDCKDQVAHQENL